MQTVLWLANLTDRWSQPEVYASQLLFVQLIHAPTCIYEVLWLSHSFYWLLTFQKQSKSFQENKQQIIKGSKLTKI